MINGAIAYALVFVGGGLGAALRHGVNRAALAALGPGFPSATMIVNVVGGLAMGVLAGLIAAKGFGDQSLRLFLATGLLGGFTTFSAFTLDAYLLWEKGEWASLLLYAAGSIVLSLAALVTGMAAVRALV